MAVAAGFFAGDLCFLTGIIMAFEKGNSYGPGRPVGSRNKLTTAFMDALYEDLHLLENVALNISDVDTMTYNTICQFGFGVAWPAVSYVRKFRPEFEAHIREGKCVVLPPDEATVPPEENYALQQRIIPTELGEV